MPLAKGLARVQVCEVGKIILTQAFTVAALVFRHGTTSYDHTEVEYTRSGRVEGQVEGGTRLNRGERHVYG